MARFSVHITVQGHTVQVEGEATKYRPARTNCSNDDACPAEGGIEEIEKVTLLDSDKHPMDILECLDETLRELAVEKYFDLVEEALDALGEEDGPDPDPQDPADEVPDADDYAKPKED